MKALLAVAVLSLLTFVDFANGRPSDNLSLENELNEAIEINGQVYVKKDKTENSMKQEKKEITKEVKGDSEKVKGESEIVAKGGSEKQDSKDKSEETTQGKKEENDGGANEQVVEGDILRSSYIDDLRSGKLNGKRAINKQAGRWTDNKYYYQLDSSLTDDMKEQVRLAIRIVDRAGCFDFIEKADSKGYVLFQKSKSGGCNSYIGKTGGMQPINVADWCKAGSLAHEILHSVGFLHEQTRPDRDQYVTIAWDHIKEKMKHNFKKYDHPVVELYNEPYDYKSLMQYGRKSFSKDEQDTIIPKDSSVTTLGQRDGLSEKDKTLLRKYYGCKPCVNTGWFCGARVTTRIDSCQRGRSTCLKSCGMWCKP